MAAPSLIDGISRAIKELGVPSTGLVVLVGMIRVTHGKQEAGIAYISVVTIILLGMYTAAKYWNFGYTVGFVTAGITVWVGIPSIFPELVPSLFANLGKLVILIFLILIAKKLTSKW